MFDVCVAIVECGLCTLCVCVRFRVCSAMFDRKLHTLVFRCGQSSVAVGEPPQHQGSACSCSAYFIIRLARKRDRPMLPVGAHGCAVIASFTYLKLTAHYAYLKMALATA